MFGKSFNDRFRAVGSVIGIKFLGFFSVHMSNYNRNTVLKIQIPFVCLEKVC